MVTLDTGQGRMTGQEKCGNSSEHNSTSFTGLEYLIISSAHSMAGINYCSLDKVGKVVRVMYLLNFAII